MHSGECKILVKEKPHRPFGRQGPRPSVEGGVGLVAIGLVGLVHRLANRAFEHLKQGGPAGSVRDLEADQGQPVEGTTANQSRVREVHTALGLNHRAEAHSEGEDLHSVGGGEDDVFHTR